MDAKFKSKFLGRVEEKYYIHYATFSSWQEKKMIYHILSFI